MKPNRLVWAVFTLAALIAQAEAATITYSAAISEGGEGNLRGPFSAAGFRFIGWYGLPRFDPALGQLDGAEFSISDAFVAVSYSVEPYDGDALFSWSSFNASMSGYAETGGDVGPGIATTASGSNIVPAVAIPARTRATFTGTFLFSPTAVKDDSDLSDLVGTDGFDFLLSGSAVSAWIYTDPSDEGYHRVDWGGTLNVTYRYAIVPTPATLPLLVGGIGLVLAATARRRCGRRGHVELKKRLLLCARIYGSTFALGTGTFRDETTNLGGL